MEVLPTLRKTGRFEVQGAPALLQQIGDMLRGLDHYATVAAPIKVAGSLWGTVIAFGLFDASSAGNLLAWDFLGNFNWLPFEVASGTGPTWTVKGNGYSSNDPVVITAATYFWTAAFVLFIAVYTPILWSPRADGRPG